MRLPRDSNLVNFKTEKARDLWPGGTRPWVKAPFKRGTSSGESHLLFMLAWSLGPGNYADVGTLHGGSTVALAHGLNSGGHRGKVYSVDLFGQRINGEKQGSVTTPAKLQAYFDKTFKDVELVICKGFSAEWAEKIQEKFKFVFIDADHSYENCKADTLGWAPKVEPGGYMAFHDSHFLSVDQVIREEMNPENWKQTHHVFTIKVFQRL